MYVELCFTLNENENTQQNEKKKSCGEVNTFNQNLHDFQTKVIFLNEQLVDSSEENNELTLVQQSLLHEGDILLAAVAKLETKKETLFKKIDNDLYMEVSIVKALLIIATKEKEQSSIYEESLYKKFNKLSPTMQSLNEQSVSLTYEEDHLMHAKEVVTLEWDDLLKRISTFKKQQEKIAEHEKQDINGNSSLLHEKTSLLNDRENLTAEIALLKKEKEDIENKLDRIMEKNTTSTSLNNSNNAFARSEHDLYAKHEQYASLIKENMQLKEENVKLVQTKDHFIHEHDNLITQIALEKKDNEEVKEKLMKEMAQLTSLKNILSKEMSKKDQLVGNEFSLMQQLNLLQVKEASQEQHQTKLEAEITTLNEIIENLFEDRNDLIKKCKKHDQMQNECSSLLKSKINLSNDCDTFFKELTILRNEKETLDKEHAANLLEKNQISASMVNLKVEVDNFNKRVFAFNEQVAQLVEENEKLHTKLEASTFKNAKISMNQEQQTCMSHTTELGILCNMELTNQLNVEFIKENKYLGMTFLDVDLESLNEPLEFFKQQQKELIKERDNAVALLKKFEEDCACIANNDVEMETPKQKLILLDKKYKQLISERDNAMKENEFLHQQYDIIFAEIYALTDESENNNSSKESKVIECVVSKEMSTMHQIQVLQMCINTLKEQQTNLRKNNKEISLENEALTKEKDSLIASISSLKKKHETILAQEFQKKEVTTLEVTLQQKFEELVESVTTLNKIQEGYIVDKEVMIHTAESFTKECNNLFAIVMSLKDEQLSPSSNVEHQFHTNMDQSIVVRKDESTKLETLLKEKLNEFAKKIVILIEGFIASTKEREQLISEMTSLKRECQKLHSTLVVAERDKDTLMKSIVESRSTFDRLAGEISRLQRELVEIEMKLTHTIGERDSANLQIADLQRLLSNHHRIQHLQGPYCMENFETLEAQNRCLRMEKVAFRIS